MPYWLYLVCLSHFNFNRRDPSWHIAQSHLTWYPCSQSLNTLNHFTCGLLFPNMFCTATPIPSFNDFLVCIESTPIGIYLTAQDTLCSDPSCFQLLLPTSHPYGPYSGQILLHIFSSTPRTSVDFFSPSPFTERLSPTICLNSNYSFKR